MILAIEGTESREAVVLSSEAMKNLFLQHKDAKRVAKSAKKSVKVIGAR